MQASDNHHWRSELPPRDSWEVPLPRFFKMSIDGAIFEEDNAFKVKIVIHDWRGRFIARKSMNFVGSVEASRVETMAAR